MSSILERLGAIRQAWIAWIARQVTQRPKRMLLVGALLLGVLIPGIDRIAQGINYYAWFEKDDPQLRYLDEFEQRFGSDLASMLVVHSPSGIFDEDSAKLLIELTDRMWKVPEVVRVESLANFAWVHASGDDIAVEDLIPHDRELTPALLAERKQVALTHEQLPGFLVSKDGKTAVIYGWLRPTKTGHGANEFNNFVANWEDLKKLVKEYKGRTDHTFYLGGFPVTEAYMEVDPPKEMDALGPVLMGACMLLLLLFFRRPSGFILPFSVIIPSVFATLGLAGWLGFPMNEMTIVAPNIMVIVSVASCDNLLHHYFRALDHGYNRKQAARYSLEESLWPAVFASLAIIIGFISLITTAYPPMRQLGVLISIACVVVWMFTWLILGPLMTILPIKPKKKKVKDAKGRDTGVEELATDEVLAMPTERAEKLTAWLDRWKIPMIAGWTLVCAVSVWLAIRNSVTLDPADWFDKRTEVRQAIDFAREEMNTSEEFEVVIETGKEDGIKDPAFLRKVDDFSTWLRAQKGISQVYSLVDILKQTNRALMGGVQSEYKLPDTQGGIAEQYLLYTLQLPMGSNINDRVTIENDALRLSVFSRLEQAPRVLAMADRMRAKAKELGLDVTLTGRQLLYHGLNQKMVPSFFSATISGTILIGLMLLAFFRSVKMALLSLITNVVPLLVGVGIILTLLDKPFDVGMVQVFVIALGVSVDDTVHFLEGYTRMRNRGFGVRGSISRLWTSIGPAMLTTALVLAGCFSLFATVIFPPIRFLGVVIALTLVVNFLADFFLGPALLLLKRDDPKDGVKKDVQEAA